MWPRTNPIGSRELGAGENSRCLHRSQCPFRRSRQSRRCRNGAGGGARLLTTGLAICHGAPGVELQKFYKGINPEPADLKDVVAETEAAELFWVIKNGIKMTGMPSFGEIGMDGTEIWSVVAFIRKLPSISEADFKTWTTEP